ncbi:hypothetical protein H5P28_14785 [Ruficoccus amylovorans]|uniref:Uncharacterized protein n=1 Tax=Ruficoccus amylovorans TaxID=1804625 RepID=A0A842HH80_9BACT|nr:hypothetical protein [Ruficoccus amylovorans]MBC2595530.1 hypothetical protein [Ruficoccus amylovorans]
MSRKRTGGLLKLPPVLILCSLLLAGCRSDQSDWTVPEDTAPAAIVQGADPYPAFENNRHAFDHLLEPPDFSQMDVVAVPAVEKSPVRDSDEDHISEVSIE